MTVYAVIDAVDDIKDYPVLSGQIYCVVKAEDAFDQIPAEAEVLVCMPDASLRSFLDWAHKSQWRLNLMVHKGAAHARRGFCLAPVSKGIIDFEQAREIEMDVLFCNGQPVLNKVVIGRAFSFQPGGHSHDFWQRLKTVWHQFRHLKDYQPQCFRFCTPANEKVVETAAVGIVSTNHVLASNLSKQLLSDGFVNDSMFYSLLVAPKSVLEMLRFFFTEPFRTNVSQPGFLSILRSSAIEITSPQPIHYRVDDLALEADEVSLVCEPQYLKLRVPSESLLVDQTARQKEIRRIHPLPKAKESIQSLVAKPLPWITHAATEDFRELYQQLRENAQASSSFLIFMVLSTLLASFGLYANSAPVIIGAMILAPLMAPIVSLAMAFTRQDEVLMLRSGKTLLTGFLLAIGCAMLLSLALPLQIETSEISARLRPTLLDLGIAIISGIAGAYANARSEVAKSLAGVAIAVALVPPLAVVGIGLGWFSWHVAGGALLLFITNLAGIVLSASATFLLLGFAPFSRARKGIVAALVAVALVSIPLALSFNQLAKEASIVALIEQVSGQHLDIRSVKVVSTGAVVKIRLEAVSTGLFDGNKIRALKEDIEASLETKTELEVNWLTLYE